MNILQGEFNCIWAGTLKGFPVKTSEIYQKLKPELHSSVTKLLQTNQLDHFTDSDTGHQDNMFSGCYFQHCHGLCQRPKYCMSHPAIELIFINITLQWQCLEGFSQCAQMYGKTLLYWKQLWRLCKIYLQAIHGFWKNICDTITLVFAIVICSLCASLYRSIQADALHRIIKEEEPQDPTSQWCHQSWFCHCIKWKWDWSWDK